MSRRMIHIRIDRSELNSERKFACGVEQLPQGDVWFYDSEHGAAQADCPGCNPQGPQRMGWSASQMDGNASSRQSNPDGWGLWLAFCDANGAP